MIYTMYIFLWYSYYIPGDAVVYGTMNNNKDGHDGEGILIFGHGTLSGDRLPYSNFADPPDQSWYEYRR